MPEKQPSRFPIESRIQLSGPHSVEARRVLRQINSILTNESITYGTLQRTKEIAETFLRKHEGKEETPAYIAVKERLLDVEIMELAWESDS